MIGWSIWIVRKVLDPLCGMWLSKTLTVDDFLFNTLTAPPKEWWATSSGTLDQVASWATECSRIDKLPVWGLILNRVGPSHHLSGSRGHAVKKLTP